jgi:hypothetical protein
MANDTETVLIRDVQLPWAGPFPYDHLAARLEEIGASPIGSESTAARINDSFFDLMAAGQPTHADRLAWDALRRTDQRLIVDFFMYEVPVHAVGAALSEAARQPVPVVLPDFLPLAHVEPDFSALRAPDHFGPESDVGHEFITGETCRRGAVDIGDVPVDVFAVLEPADER